MNQTDDQKVNPKKYLLLLAARVLTIIRRDEIIRYGKNSLKLLLVNFEFTIQKGSEIATTGTKGEIYFTKIVVVI